MEEAGKILIELTREGDIIDQWSVRCKKCEKVVQLSDKIPYEARNWILHTRTCKQPRFRTIQTRSSTKASTPNSGQNGRKDLREIAPKIAKDKAKSSRSACVPKKKVCKPSRAKPPVPPQIGQNVDDTCFASGKFHPIHVTQEEIRPSKSRVRITTLADVFSSHTVEYCDSHSEDQVTEAVSSPYMSTRNIERPDSDIAFQDPVHYICRTTIDPPGNDSVAQTSPVVCHAQSKLQPGSRALRVEPRNDIETVSLEEVRLQPSLSHAMDETVSTTFNHWGAQVVEQRPTSSIAIREEPIADTVQKTGLELLADCIFSADFHAHGATNFDTGKVAGSVGTCGLTLLANCIESAIFHSQGATDYDRGKIENVIDPVITESKEEIDVPELSSWYPRTLNHFPLFFPPHSLPTSLTSIAIHRPMSPMNRQVIHDYNAPIRIENTETGERTIPNLPLTLFLHMPVARTARRERMRVAAREIYFRNAIGHT